jgi:hypothetical protein
MVIIQYAFIMGFTIVENWMDWKGSLPSRVLKSIKRMNMRLALKIKIHEKGMTSTGEELCCHMKMSDTKLETEDNSHKVHSVIFPYTVRSI